MTANAILPNDNAGHCRILVPHAFSAPPSYLTLGKGSTVLRFPVFPHSDLCERTAAIRLWHGRETLFFLRLLPTFSSSSIATCSLYSYTVDRPRPLFDSQVFRHREENDVFPLHLIVTRLVRIHKGQSVVCLNARSPSTSRLMIGCYQALDEIRPESS